MIKIVQSKFLICISNLKKRLKFILKYAQFNLDRTAISKTLCAVTHEIATGRNSISNNSCSLREIIEQEILKTWGIIVQCKMSGISTYEFIIYFNCQDLAAEHQNLKWLSYGNELMEGIFLVEM